LGVATENRHNSTGKYNVEAKIRDGIVLQSDIYRPVTAVVWTDVKNLIEPINYCNLDPAIAS
jgi:predicted acyl esterase